MAQADKTFAGPIPAIYDRYLVPLIFEPYAQDMAARIERQAPNTILETAAGTGVLTRAMTELLPKARITATDLNQAMLDQAISKSPDAERTVWKQADALSLPLEEASVDLVACQFGVMFFPDRVAGYKEARRVLKPDGSFVFNVWDDIAHNAFPNTVMNAIAELFPDDPPTFMARVPHGYHDEDRIRADLDAAGFSDVSIEPVDFVCHADSALDVATGFCQGTPMRGEIETRDSKGLEEATRKSAERLEKHFGHGPIEAGIRALVITAR